MPGLHDFVAGAVLTAAQMDELAQQTVIADTSFPTASHEGMTCYRQDENRLYQYNGGWIRTSIYTAANGRTGVYCERVANQSITNTSATNVNFDTENYDSDGFITVNSTTVTIPAGLGGLYTVHANCIWASTPAGLANDSYLEITAGGDFSRNNSISTRNSVGQTLALSAGDSITVAVYQSSGASINLTDCRLRAWRLGP